MTVTLRGEGKAITYTYDPLGRMASITYPDGEKISYTYDPGGQVTGINAARGDGTRTVLVKKIGYDQYGQRTYLEYGNGNITATIPTAISPKNR